MEKTMFKQNTLKVIVASSLIAGAVSVVAQESVTSNATVTVSNAFDLVETQPISFGSITAIGYNYTSTGSSGTLQATVTVPANGSAPSAGTTGTADADPTDTDSAISILTPGQRGLYDISNAAPFTALVVTLPSSVALSAPSAPPGNGTFILDNFTAVNTDGGADASTSITTNATGAAQIGLGATILTNVPAATGNLTYIDATYSGSYTLQVSY
jgi:hypothetical protein